MEKQWGDLASSTMVLTSRAQQQHNNHCITARLTVSDPCGGQDSVARRAAEFATKIGDEALLHNLSRLVGNVGSDRRICEPRHADGVVVKRFTSSQSLAASGVLQRLTDPDTLEKVAVLQQLMPLGEGETSRFLREEFPTLIHAGTRMIESGMLEPEVVSTLGELGVLVAAAQQETRHSPPQPVGFLRLLRAMRDPQFQQAIGVLLHVGERFGEHVQQAAKE